MPLEDFTENAALQDFAGQVHEVTPVVVDSVLGKHVEVVSAALRPTSDADMEESFGSLRHGAVEFRIAVSDVEAHLMTLLMTTPVLSALTGEKIEAESLEGDAADAVLDQLRRSATEFIDLLTLMLFTDSPLRAEMTVSDVRIDSLAETVGMILDTAAGAPLYRLDVDLNIGDTESLSLTLLVPETLLTGLAAGLHPNTAAAAIETPSAAEEAAPQPIRSAPEPVDEPPILVEPLEFPALEAGSDLGEGMGQPLELLRDISMRVSVELGRAKLTVQEILNLGPGSVVELDKLAGEAVDILVNDRLIARGEVVMVDENFGVRVTEILTPGSVNSLRQVA